MRSVNNNTIKDNNSGLKEFPLVKLALYTGVVVAGLYAAGKLFRATASCVRGFNDFRASIKGR